MSARKQARSPTVGVLARGPHARIERQLDRLTYVAANVEPERGRIDLSGDVRQVPAHVEAIIGRKDALIKDFKGCFEQWRASALQEHHPLLRKVRDQVAPAVG